MTAENRDKSTAFAVQVGAEIARVRKSKGLSYEALSKTLDGLGQRIPVLGLSKLEKGERRVDVTELVALAQAFGVPPIALLFPVGRAEATELSPGQFVDPWLAARWFSGLAELDDRAPSQEAGVLRMFAQHDRLVEDAADSKSDVELGLGEDDLTARAAERRWRIALRDLRDLRARIRQLGLTPPPLNTFGDFLDVVDDHRYRFLTRDEAATNIPRAGGLPPYPPGLTVEDTPGGGVRPVDFSERE